MGGMAPTVDNEPYQLTKPGNKGKMACSKLPTVLALEPIQRQRVIAARNMKVLCSILSTTGFILVVIGFSTRYWYFCENSRWQFKCDLRTCCVRDIDPAPKFWTCWPIKDPPKVFRIATAITYIAFALWLPSILCFLAARAKLRPHVTSMIGLLFLMMAGILGVVGCNFLFETAKEEFVIAEYPGVSGRMVQVGSCLALAGSTLALTHTLLYCLDKVLVALGALIGCLTALGWILLRAVLIKLSPAAVSLKPRLSSAIVASKRRLRSVAVKHKPWLRKIYNLIQPFASRVISWLRPRIFAILAFFVLVTSVILTYVESKLIVIFRYALGKVAAAVGTLSPEFSAVLSLAQTLLDEQKSFYQATFQLVVQLVSHILIYLQRLLQPPFYSTLTFVMAKTARPHRTVVSRAVELHASEAQPV